MATKLTATTVAQAGAKSVPYEVADAGCPGLRLAVQTSGAKSWVMRFRSPIERDHTGKGKARKLTLGALAASGRDHVGTPSIGGALSLADARALATDVVRKIRQGIDPAQERRTERQTRTERSNLVEDVAAEFMTKHVRKRNGEPIRGSARYETGRLLGLVLNRDDLSGWKPRKPYSGVLAYWAGRDIQGVTKRDVLDLLDSIVERGSPVSANNTLAALKSMFRWCVKRDILAASPCEYVDAPSPQPSVKRDLSGIEIVALWRAAERIGYPYGKMVQLLVLVGQRRDEVRESPRHEFDLPNRIWKLPAARAKNGREHLIPLSDGAVAIIAGLPKIKSKGGWLFVSSDVGPSSNLSKRKRQLDALMLEELRKIDPEISELQPWRLHDLRHALKTWMQRVRIPKDVRNAVQNHYDGGMDELYGHYSFEKEKRETLEKWAQHIAEITSGGNIVELRHG
jgi:integrase